MTDAKTKLMTSKAGRRFAGFMKAFNTGDADIVYDFVKQYTTDEALEKQSVTDWTRELLRIHRATGGLKLHDVLDAEEYRVRAVLQAKGGVLVETTMTVSEEYPHKVAQFIQQPASENYTS